MGDDCINERNFRNMLNMPNRPIYFQIWVWASHGLNVGWSNMWYGGKPNLTAQGFDSFWEGVVHVEMEETDHPGVGDRKGWAPEKFLDDEYLIKRGWLNRTKVERNYKYWDLSNVAMGIPH